MGFSRRKFIQISSAVMLSNAATMSSEAGQKKQALSAGVFSHGVASGDPLQQQVIIWTRVTPTMDVSVVRVGYEVSLDQGFSSVVQSGLFSAQKEQDYTIKIDLQDLQPDTLYFYRFKTSNAYSSTGRTRTLPIQTDSVALAVFSCAHFSNGYFNAYHDACKFKDKIDVVIHLGDYIYENGMQDKEGNPGYGASQARQIGRELAEDNKQALLTLHDYRRRYATYRSDPDLQSLHSLFPFICIWDDHEVVDNAYRDGAKEYTAQSEHDYHQRKAVAVQAYLEWMPVRMTKQMTMPQIYRSFDFGSLLSLHMLDTRLMARDRPLDYRDYLKSDDNFDLADFARARFDPNRHLLGNAQLDWLHKMIQKSSAQWQLIGQQVRLSENLIPSEIVQQAVRYNRVSGDQKAQTKQQMIESIQATVRIKARMSLADTSVTSQEAERLQSMLPYNLDAWDGYAAERERLYRTIQQHKKPVVVLSGDAHYAWASELTDEGKRLLGIELGVTSVSSPGIEEEYGVKDGSLLQQLEKASSVFDSRSLYANYRDRGYLIVEIDRSEIKAHWRFVSHITNRDYRIKKDRNHSLRIAYRDGQYYYR